MLRPFVPWLIVFAVTAGTGAVAGALGNRWGAPPDVQAAAGRLDRLPAEAGDWQLVDELPLDQDLVEMFQCIGSTNRTYRNRQSGETVHLSLIVGPPGPTSVHTPEICYSSQGYHVDVPAERRKYPTKNSEATVANEFWKTTFAPDGRRPTRLIAYYSWCDGQTWRAPDRPRFAFGGLPYLYKVQLATKIMPRADEDRDPCDDFLRALLPALSQSGFYGPSARRVTTEI